jgi:hypothetical protein
VLDFLHHPPPKLSSEADKYMPPEGLYVPNTLTLSSNMTVPTVVVNWVTYVLRSVYVNVSRLLHGYACNTVPFVK